MERIQRNAKMKKAELLPLKVYPFRVKFMYVYFPGPLTWCRRVYLLRTTVRLCHSELKRKQSVDLTDKTSGQATDAGFSRRRGILP